MFSHHPVGSGRSIPVRRVWSRDSGLLADWSSFRVTSRTSSERARQIFSFLLGEGAG